MSKKGVLRLAGIIIVPLLLMAVAAYFLYPYLNEEEYKAIAEKYDRSNGAVAKVEGMEVGKDFQTLVEQVKLLKTTNKQLNVTLDSLQKKNIELTEKVKTREEQINDEQTASADAETKAMQTTPVSQTKVPEENFEDRVKSLLNLDNEDLTPIINEMTDQQVIRLYKGAGSMQQKKLLRSLDPKRAAKLMTEVML